MQAPAGGRENAAACWGEEPRVGESDVWPHALCSGVCIVLASSIRLHVTPANFLLHSATILVVQED